MTVALRVDAGDIAPTAPDGLPGHARLVFRTSAGAGNTRRARPRWHDERGWAALLCLALHVLLVAWLWRGAAPRARVPDAATRTVLVLLTPPPAPVRPSAAPTRTPPVAAPMVAPPPRPAPESRDVAPVATPSAPPAPRDRALDLRLPPDVVRSPESSVDPSPWQRPPVLETQTTAFAGDWTTDGDLVDYAKERSKTAAVLLGLFGGRPPPCTDDERRERHPRCVPDNAANEFLPRQ